VLENHAQETRPKPELRLNSSSLAIIGCDMNLKMLGLCAAGVSLLAIGFAAQSIMLAANPRFLVSTPLLPRQRGCR